MKWLASIGLSGSVLALFAAITSVAIGWTYLGTKAQIDFEVRRAEAFSALPASNFARSVLKFVRSNHGQTKGLDWKRKIIVPSFWPRRASTGSAKRYHLYV